MTTPIDDLHVGQWIAVVESAEHETDFNPFSMFAPTPRSKVTGQPLKIVAISLPFLAVSDGHRRFPIDVREVQVKKLHKKYVECLKARQAIEERPNSGPTFAVAETEKAAEKKPEGKFGLCPVCGDRLIQRKSTGDWHLACRECGFEGGYGKDNA